MTPIPVYLEIGRKKVFACSLEWPGWCRSGRDEDEALTALAHYGSRFAPVPARVPLRFAAAARTSFEVVERLAGNATTDFGAPAAIAAADAAPLDPSSADRLADLVEAAWATLDDAAAVAPAELRKGPRGGGRDRDPMVAHVVAAEAAYARKLGVRHRSPDPGDRAAVEALRADVARALRQAGRAGGTGGAWPPRYAARRIAWHVLDHTWEMEDRAERAGPDGG